MRPRKPYSGIALVCLSKEENSPDTDTRYVEDNLVVVSYVTLSQTEQWFTGPKEIVEVISDLRQADILIDALRISANLQQRARKVQWTDYYQAKANAGVSNELVGLIEEVH